MTFKGSAAAAFVIGLSAPVAHASDYGCQVLLCLSNPQGPRAVSECRPPIDRLFRDLARGRSFPTCDLASAPNQAGGRSWAQQTYNYYDVCPEGTTALASGSFAIVGIGSSRRAPPNASIFSGVGEGAAGWPEEGQLMPPKTCVGNRVGSTTALIAGEEGGLQSVPVAVYDRAFTLNNSNSPRAIDVYIDSQLYRRVRW